MNDNQHGDMCVCSSCKFKRTFSSLAAAGKIKVNDVWLEGFKTFIDGLIYDEQKEGKSVSTEDTRDYVETMQKLDKKVCGCPVCRSRKDGGQEMTRELYNSLISNNLFATTPSNVGPSSPVKKSPHSFSNVVKYLKEDNDAVFRWDVTEVRIRFDGVNLKYDRCGSVSNLIVTTDILNGVFFLEERTTRDEKILRLLEDSLEDLNYVNNFERAFTTRVLNNLKEIKAIITEDLR